MKDDGQTICSGRSATNFDVKYADSEYQLLRCSLINTEVSIGTVIDQRKL